MIKVQGIPRYRLDELQAMPTLTVASADDLKYDDGTTRLWLSRVGAADDAPMADVPFGTATVTVERLDRKTGKWVMRYLYDARRPLTVAYVQEG